MKPLKSKAFNTIPGEYYGTPKEMWGFRTGGSGKGPEERAREFLKAHYNVLGLPANLRGIRKPKIIESLGAYHVIFQQWHKGRRVHRAFVTVHMDKKGHVYLAKNRVLPRKFLPDAPFDANRAKAIAAARQCLLKKPGPVPKGMTQKRERRTRLCGKPEERWYPVADSLVPALRVRLERRKPTEAWVVYVNARTNKVLDKYDNLARAVTGKARVFDPNPVVALDSHDGLVANERKQRTYRIPDEAYSRVTLHGLKGNGRLEGKRVTTSHTNRRHRVSRKHHVYEMESGQKGFEEVMVYYHIDAAIRYLESLGYKGRRRIFKNPVRVNVNGSRDDNSWYEAWRDLLTFGTGYVDDAEDGEIILHELGHALQNQIVPNWGASDEAAAMGEGFGDYFAASFFYEKKSKKYRRTMMSWNGLFDGLWYWRHEKNKKVKAKLWPPAQRFMDAEWDYDWYDDAYDEHENGEIWAVTLWDIFRKLGRNVADRIIIESHFQLDPYTTFARGARAIMDADENLFAGAHVRKLKNIFNKRKIKWQA